MAASSKHIVNTPVRAKRSDGFVVTKEEEIPSFLIYEVLDNKPVYYAGYKEVLAKRKQPEQIMGSSGLQSFLIVDIIAQLLLILPPAYYRIGTNESGIMYQKGNWVNSDIIIFRKENLTEYKLDDTYLKIPPQVVIEVDTKADFSGFSSSSDYFYAKTQRLLDFGVEKVIWLFTNENSRKVMVATNNADWTISNWNKEIEVLDGKTVNFDLLLKNL